MNDRVRSPHATRRRIATASGVVLIVVGLTLLGYVGWQLWGTNIIAERRQGEVADSLRDAWARDGTTATTDFGEAEALLRVPRWGDDYEVPVLRGTSDDVLSSGIGHFDDTAGPGEVGNYALAGHRITRGEPLRHMPDLERGDEIVIETAEATYTYRLLSAGDELTVTFHDTWVIEPDPLQAAPTGALDPVETQGSGRFLTLTTCAELFHTDDRLIAFAELSSVSHTAAR